MLGLLGRKLGQTRVYDAAGRLLPVTVVLAGPNRVLQRKTKETDGYDAVQLGFGNQKIARLTKAVIGHLTKHGAIPSKAPQKPDSGPAAAQGTDPVSAQKATQDAQATNAESKPASQAQSEGQSDGEPAKARQLTGVAKIREFRDFPLDVKTGDLIGPGTPGMFAPGDFVDAIGITKGRGFEGVVRRHRFRGGDLTHGSKGWHRRPGAIGQRLFPGTVRRGLRMPGHMGRVKRTIQNLEVVHVLPEDHLLLVKGAIPGAKGDYVIIREAKKRSKAFVHALREKRAKAASETKKRGGTKAAK